MGSKPLTNGIPPPAPPSPTFLTTITNLLSRLNPILLPHRLHLFEICDLAHCPAAIRASCQAMLTAQWTTRLPLLQTAAPASHAAELLTTLISRIEHANPARSPDVPAPAVTVVDFCSGAGGPIPTIERLVNASRRRASAPPIDFLLTDLHPHLSAWRAAAARSEHLRYIAQPVDAADPPAAARNPGPATTTTDPQPRTLTLRTFHLSFHHLPDPPATHALRSALASAHGLAIIELQDRRPSSLLLMFLEFIFVLGVTWAWFPRDAAHLLLTYAVPLLPAVQAWDGAVSCLRTRTFEEVVGLVAGREEGVVVRGEEEGMQWAEVGGWVFEGGRKVHTWPLGYVNWVVAWRKGEAGARAGA